MMNSIKKYFADRGAPPPLNSEHISRSKLSALKTALSIFYIGTPVSFLFLIIMFILDNNHPVADNVMVVIGMLVMFFITMGAFVVAVASPIFRRLMNISADLDEGEIYLQRSAYSYAYRIMFKFSFFVMCPFIFVNHLMTTEGVFSIDLPQVDGSFILLSIGITVMFCLMAVIMLPTVYLAWNLKPVGEED